MDRLHYFTNVLGIREVMLPPAAVAAVTDESVVVQAVGTQATPVAPKGPYAKLIVLDEPGAQPLANNQMFLKMMDAIGLSPSDLRVLEYRPDELAGMGLSDDERALPVLSFSSALTQALSENPPSLLQTTFGPRDLAKNEQLKRQTWTDLQSFTKKIGLGLKPKS